MNFEFGWGSLDEVSLAQIEPDKAFSRTRRFLAALSIDRRDKLFDLYLCAGQHNAELRNLLDQLGNIRVFSSAGNVVFNPSRRPAVILAHGPHCGAVDYVRKLGMEHSDAVPEFPVLATEVADGILGNARCQLARIAPESRGGIIYFDHEQGKLELYCNDEQSQPYAQHHVAEFIYRELFLSLVDRFPQAQLQAHFWEQNPAFTLVCPPQIRPHGYNYFEINFQNGYEFHGVIRDSIAYAVSRTLTEPGSGQSFSETPAFVVAFTDELRDNPEELFGTLERERNRLVDYLRRGGSIFCVVVGHLPSGKRIYRLRIPD
ncbi:MAG: hypothetical protein KAG92_05440 [Deltaproteobacteria bacterium]|nr:hypothetical protein [Deltaproteobacteria bacterium]